MFYNDHENKVIDSLIQILEKLLLTINENKSSTVQLYVYDNYEKEILLKKLISYNSYEEHSIFAKYKELYYLQKHPKLILSVNQVHKTNDFW